MNFQKAAEDAEAYIIKMRRYFHRHPELSLLEVNTTAKIKDELLKMGLTPIEYDNHTGLYCYIEGTDSAKNRKTVALRADIDALPITECSALPFASIQDGVMHACGHDCHIAMLLGAAKILSSHTDSFPGRIKLLFQAGEEVSYGADFYIKNNFCNDIDAIFAMHVWGDFDAPYISIEEGSRMASCDNFRIKIRGRAAHGAAPHKGCDAIVAAAHTVVSIQSIVSRMSDPLVPLVITIGKIEGGQFYNIIADKAELTGTVRTHSPQLRMAVEKMLRKTAEGTAQNFNCTAELDYSYHVGPVINEHNTLTSIARRAAIRLYGPEILGSMPKTMSSEDFSLFMEKVPGVHAFIGARNKEKHITQTNHSDKFTVDEDILKRGAALYAQFAADYLTEP
ncbi:amidohydrolase [Pectinatus haikarae]|uniref:Amidohydrolase n=1 Tax=Pectinatus haikarae TaxID=349096 RepID=A0ABT9Y8B3_9FIRM|nr:amidohydrolase [Pectinatus haikarae]MDQ0203878.1 amidohydrolase [Pectinatus haikarae]